MKPKQMVCSLEWSQKLIDAGIVVESHFCWILDRNNPKIYVAPAGGYSEADQKRYGYTIVCPAPLFPELAELLPSKISPDRYSVYDSFSIDRSEGVYEASYEGESMDECSCLHATEANTPANAVAAMLIWLKKNGHLEEEK